MSEEFIRDLVVILRERKLDVAKSLQKSDFEKGEEFAYYDVLDIIKNQLIAFGYDAEVFGLDRIKLSEDGESHKS